ncbi:DNA polymerase III subunit delta [Pontibacter sp. G13]|uniref:DNA polymerase III subunit delta n=1 Tax=Pontibacter sp. G13 TaxID=3074898 RepID=UPI002889E8AF|nr:DNA polymerase III subunit delta [Pontibacter sp. G13]WNJ21039.1 DNA polymerase III subunit delta [Pontibacter sp. G13]
MTANQLIQSIQQGQLAPVYYLHGAEDYFIDKIAQALMADGAVLHPHEVDFNREVFVGPETKASQVINACRSFPVMAQRRLVVIKEAHRMPKPEMEKVGAYLQQPVPSTVLVLLFKDPRAALGKKVVAGLTQAGGIDFHAKRMYDRDVVQWVDGFIRDSGFDAEPGIGNILVTNLGTNLGLIENELEKIFINLRIIKQTHLSKEFLFEMINIDKDFNVFELIGAISKRNAPRAHMIADRLTRNPKINPPTLMVSALYQFFHQVAMVHQLKFKDPNSIKNGMKVNYYQAQDYLAGAKTYPKAIVYRNIGFLEHADLQLKGQIQTSMEAPHIIKTLVWRIMN